MLNTNETALAVLTPEVAIQRAKAAYQIVKEMREAVLVKGVDFGEIPGTDKPTLLKPGAEKLVRAFGYCPVFETVSKVENWDDESPLFHYEIRCRLIRIEDGKEIATGVGSCNSKENKYRWRWVNEEDIPDGTVVDKLKVRRSTRSEYAFAIEKAETGGQYGKAAEYWKEWQEAIAAGTARKIYKTTRSGKQSDAWEMGSAVYRIPNDEVFSLVNTIEKMASKRALIAAVLIGTNASEFFTQYMEDLRDFGGIDEDGVIIGKIAPEKHEDKPADVLPAPQSVAPVVSSPTVQKPAETPEKPVYWVKNDAELFFRHWTQVKGLTQTEVLGALGVKSLSEWTKGRGAADARMREWLNSQIPTGK